MQGTCCVVHTLNLGILAHVDAGKTTLTERILHAAGVIDTVGRVDDGNTHTDTLALEQQRGITIKSAVVSFELNGATVNLIDTPGHPDFIAEVERVLAVLDGVVLVISAVEGVQAQTLVLMRTLQRLKIPTLLFVNKIDRPGARDTGLLTNVTDRLTPAVATMNEPHALGSPDAATTLPPDEVLAMRLTEVLADHDADLMADFVERGEPWPINRLRTSLSVRTRDAVVHPLYFGSAATGAGIDQLLEGVRELLPAANSGADGPVSGSVFKIERGSKGEKITYVRMFSGTIHVRDRILFGSGLEGKVTSIRVFDHAQVVTGDRLLAGQIGRLSGLVDVQIGDTIGECPPGAADHHFAPPTLETVVVPERTEDKGALHTALVQLVEQDPLINLRQNDVLHELSVSLYGEVQKEVIQTTLSVDFGLDVSFRETTPICVERPVQPASALALLGQPDNPFTATLELQITPTSPGSGLRFERRIDPAHLPTHLFKAVEFLESTLEDGIRHTLREGLSGWEVTDCCVTVTHFDYVSPGTSASDFRKLTPIVIMRALEQAGTVVCEPIQHFRLDVPYDTLAAVLAALAKLEAVPESTTPDGSTVVVEGDIRSAIIHHLQRQLPALTRGEGLLESGLGHYAPVRGQPPTRARTMISPLRLKEYVTSVGGHLGG